MHDIGLLGEVGSLNARNDSANVAYPFNWNKTLSVVNSAILGKFYSLTEPSNDEGCHEPSLRSDHLVKMGEIRDREQNNENGSCGYRGIIVVEDELPFWFGYFKVCWQCRRTVDEV